MKSAARRADKDCLGNFGGNQHGGNIGIFDAQIIMAPVRIELGKSAPAIIDRYDATLFPGGSAGKRLGKRPEVGSVTRQAGEADDRHARVEWGPIVSHMKAQS